MSAVIASPRETAAAIGETGGATYVDVRTVEEFVGGRPVGRVVNVPLEFYHPTTAAVHDNAAFELVCQHALDAGAAVIVGGDDGSRAGRAAERLLAAGFSDVRVMALGLSAWVAEGLATTKDNRDGVSYVSLLTPARRAK